MASILSNKTIARFLKRHQQERQEQPELPKQEPIVCVGRWLGLVIETYCTMCYLGRMHPFHAYMTDEDGTPSWVDFESEAQQEKHQLECNEICCKNFEKATISTRDRLLQETSSLMVVSALLAQLSLTLLTSVQALPGSPWEDALNWGMFVSSLMSLFASLGQLLVGFRIGYELYGPSVLAFTHFLMTKQPMVAANRWLFYLALVSLVFAVTCSSLVISVHRSVAAVGYTTSGVLLVALLIALQFAGVLLRSNKTRRLLCLQQDWNNLDKYIRVSTLTASGRVGWQTLPFADYAKEHQYIMSLPNPDAAIKDLLEGKVTYVWQ